jgi:siderophore synthetase component
MSIDTAAPVTRGHLPPADLADAATVQGLLRCWVRETGTAVPPAGPIALPLPSLGVTVATDVAYRSATGLHRFTAAHLDDGGRRPLDAVTLAALLASEAAARRDGTGAQVGDLVERVAESRRRVAAFLAARGAEEVEAGPVDAFLDGEQALLLGHLLHPAPKSRGGISDADSAEWSPELRGTFSLHWFAADPAIVAADTVAGSPAMGGSDVRELLGGLSGITGRPGRVLVPAHPWQARDLLARPAVAQLLAAGLLEPLGPAGPAWCPTSSLRTVYRPDAPVMLKLSLGLRVTNSRRENTRTELVRGVEVHRLLDAGIAAEVAARCPGFRIVRDPAWLAVHTPDDPAGRSPTHLDVSVREAGRSLPEAVCLAGLLAPQADLGASRLTRTVQELSRRTGRPVHRVAEEWIGRYVDAVLVPMLDLYATTGIGLEAHQQNTLVLPDRDGWPAAGWFRDNQGYYLAESGLPGALARTGATQTSLALVDDRVVDERLTYYLLLNQVLGVVGTLGSEGVAAEEDLLAVIRQRLADFVAAGRDTRTGLVDGWLTAARLPGKANLLTSLSGVDEVLAPLEAQSVYLPVGNPLLEASR